MVKSLSSIEAMRLLVLGVAVLLWLNVYGLASQQKEVLAPIMLSNLSAELAVATPLTGIQTVVSGNPKTLTSLGEGSLGFNLDLSQIVGVGTYTLPVTLKTSSPGVKVVNFQPKELEIVVSHRTSKLVPVEVILSGAAANGYRVENTHLPVSQVSISGASELLASLSSATILLTLSGQRHSFTTTAPVVVLDGQGHTLYNIESAPRNLEVAVNIAPGASTRTLGLVPKFAGELPGGYWVREVIFEPRVVTVSGDDKTLQSLQALTTTPLRLSERRESFLEQVAVELPKGVQMVGENLISARVIVERSAGTTQFSVVPTYASIGQGLTVGSLEPATVRVVVSGEADVLANISRSDILLLLNLEGMASGGHTIALSPDMFQTPEGVSVVSINPSSVELVLSRV